jgi:GT2 family glycosyltransferase
MKETVMSISIIIINKNDRGIAETLTALLKIKNPIPYEIIVVDASDGKLSDIKRNFPTVSWYDFKQANYGKRTIPQQRNYGLEKSVGDIIVFIDANCIPSTNWLMNLTFPITSENEKIVAGSYRSMNTKTIHDDDNDRRYGQKYITECPTMNVAFSREIFDTVGVFDEKMKIGEDADLCWRATFVGFKIRFAPEAKVYHDWGNQMEEFKRAFRYGRGRVRLYLKHPNNWKNLFPIEIAVAAYPLYILGLPLTFFFWPYPLLILIPIFKNIRNFPIRKVSYQLVYAIGIFRGLISA